MKFITAEVVLVPRQGRVVDGLNLQQGEAGVVQVLCPLGQRGFSA